VRRRLTPLVIATAVLLVAAAPAEATTQTASGGGVTATFSFNGSPPRVTDMRLQIEQGGQSYYDAPVSTSLCDHRYCGPAMIQKGTSSVQVVDLDGIGHPNVILSLFSGGANCCFIDQIFTFDPGTMTFQTVTKNFEFDGAEVKDLGHNGKYEFVSADGSFRYEFTDGADSGDPIEILSFNGLTFKNVTRSYPALIEANAKLFLNAFKHDLSNGCGLIAAWAADEDMLGHSAEVSSYLQQQLKAGHLNNPGAPIQPGGKKFIALLQKFLRKHGYLG
jgi:hypothetical protein